MDDVRIGGSTVVEPETDPHAAKNKPALSPSVAKAIERCSAGSMLRSALKNVRVEVSTRFGSWRASLPWLASTIALGAWVRPGLPTAGLDESWLTAINLAGIQGQDFGREMVFTFGPWGFLDHPFVVSRRQFALGVLFSVVATSAMWGSAYVCLRRVISKSAAGPLALIATIATQGNEPGVRLMCATAVFAVLVLQRTQSANPGWRDTWPVAAVGGAAALMLQVKFSEGIVLLTVAAILTLSAASRHALIRNLVVAVASFASCFVALWLIAGQSLRDVSDWLRASFELSSGYREAMATERPDQVLDYALAALVTATIITLAVRGARGLRKSSAIGLVLLVLACLELAFKHGFVRHDGHELTFFSVAGFLLIALARWGRQPLTVLTVAGIALAFSSYELGQFNPHNARTYWRTSVEAIFDGSYRDNALTAAADLARTEYALPQSLVNAIGSHPVTVDPWDSTLPWAYSMNWHPAPVFQTYAAYTPYLDELNAQAIVDAPADQVVLRRLDVALDGRNPSWDSPRYLLAVTCNYVAVEQEGGWLLLRHDVDRCSPAQTLSRTHVRADEPIDVPLVGPDEIVVARFSPSSDGVASRLISAVLKDWTPFWVTTNGHRFRVPEALAGGPFIVTAPIGATPTSDGFAYESLSFSKPGTVEFQVISVALPAIADQIEND